MCNLLLTNTCPFVIHKQQIRHSRVHNEIVGTLKYMVVMTDWLFETTDATEYVVLYGNNNANISVANSFVKQF